MSIACNAQLLAQNCFMTSVDTPDLTEFSVDVAVVFTAITMSPVLNLCFSLSDFYYSYW